MSVGWSVGRIESLIHSKSLIVDDFANTCECLTSDQRSLCVFLCTPAFVCVCRGAIGISLSLMTSLMLIILQV